jgi:hypothetical protein
VAEVALDEIGERRVLQVPHSNMTLKSINVDISSLRAVKQRGCAETDC